jgi:hypothetical protein
MDFNEALEAGGATWNSDLQEFDDTVAGSDWVLVSKGPGPLYYRVVLTFDESMLDFGDSPSDLVTLWEDQSNSDFDYYIVEDFLELIEMEVDDPDNSDWDEDQEQQWLEDERWRDDL